MDKWFRDTEKKAKNHGTKINACITTNTAHCASIRAFTLSFMVDPCYAFIDIIQDYVRAGRPQCQWSNPGGYGNRCRYQGPLLITWVNIVCLKCIDQDSLYHNMDIGTMWHSALVSCTSSQSIRLVLGCSGVERYGSTITPNDTILYFCCCINTVSAILFII